MPYHALNTSLSTPQGFRVVDTPGIPSKHQAIIFHSCCLCSRSMAGFALTDFKTNIHALHIRVMHHHESSWPSFITECFFFNVFLLKLNLFNFSVPLFLRDSKGRYIRFNILQMGCNLVRLFVLIDQATLSFGSHCYSHLFSALGSFDQLHFLRPGHISFAGSD